MRRMYNRPWAMAKKNLEKLQVAKEAKI